MIDEPVRADLLFIRDREKCEDGDHNDINLRTRYLLQSLTSLEEAIQGFQDDRKKFVLASSF